MNRNAGTRVLDFPSNLQKYTQSIEKSQYYCEKALNEYGKSHSCEKINSSSDIAMEEVNPLP
ncbi:hypothetical protein QE390_003861 [Siphonobacter sp. SORGH_AS 1065]|nr:hypothetical protein [Siphonobacter sp. SORGH_AS_1065]